MKKKQLRRRRRQRTSQPRYCQLGQFLCLGQFPGQSRRWCQVCDDHSVGPGIHRYESCRGVTCQEVYGQNVEQSSKERVAKEETPDKAPDYKNWGRMSEIIGKQLVAIAGLERYVETPNHAEPSHTVVAASDGSTAKDSRNKVKFPKPGIDQAQLLEASLDTGHQEGCWDWEVCRYDSEVCRYDTGGE